LNRCTDELLVPNFIRSKYAVKLSCAKILEFGVSDTQPDM